jgi:hypothetical protein
VFGRLDAAFYLALSFDHGVAAHARSRGDGALAAASEHLRAGPCHDTALALVQMWPDDLEESRTLGIDAEFLSSLRVSGESQ